MNEGEDYVVGEYNIVLMHGPVVDTEYIGNDAVIFTLDDGRKFTIRFAIENRTDRKTYIRDIKDSSGVSFYDETEFDVFGDNLTTEDYAQWTADNFSEIEELIDCSEDV